MGILQLPQLGYVSFFWLAPLSRTGPKSRTQWNTWAMSQPPKVAFLKNGPCIFEEFKVQPT